MANDSKSKWAILIYMAVDDANGIPESKQFLEELDALKHLIGEQKPNQFQSRDLRICLQAYTNWSNIIVDDISGFGSRRFEIDENFCLDHPLDVKDDVTLGLSMGSAEALKGFISWGKARCEAENNLLFLWGHGTGSSMFSLEDSYKKINELYDGNITFTDLDRDIEIKIDDLPKEKLFRGRKKVPIRVTLPGATSFDITVARRNTDFYKKLIKNKKDKHGDEYPNGFGLKEGEIDKSDELIDLLFNEMDPRVLNPQIQRLKKYLSTRSNLDALLEHEIRECLSEKGNEIDILLIMGCCMQMVEFGYEVRNGGKNDKPFYYIASEELIYFDGYNYKDSFKALVENPFMQADELAKRIISDAPVKNTYSEYERQSIVVSCADLSKSNKLAAYLEKFADLILEIKNENMKADVWGMIKKARKHCRHFGEDDYTYSFIDVTWFFINLSEIIKSNHKNYPKDLPALVQDIIDFMKNDYIVQSWVGAGKIPSRNYLFSYGAYGVAIYFPDSEQSHKDNKNLGIFFQREVKGNANRVANEFTRTNRWNELIFEYMYHYGEKGNYKGSVVPADDEKKQLLIEKEAFIHELTTSLLEKDKIIAEVIPDFLLKNSSH